MVGQFFRTGPLENQIADAAYGSDDLAKRANTEISVGSNRGNALAVLALVAEVRAFRLTLAQQFEYDRNPLMVAVPTYPEE